MPALIELREVGGGNAAPTKPPAIMHMAYTSPPLIRGVGNVGLVMPADGLRFEPDFVDCPDCRKWRETAVDHNEKNHRYEKDPKADEEKGPDGESKKENTLLLRSTRKRSLSSLKHQVQRIKCGRFSSLHPTDEDPKIEEESDISGHYPSEIHSGTAQIEGQEREIKKKSLIRRAAHKNGNIKWSRPVYVYLERSLETLGHCCAGSLEQQ
ncbi:hypothetical protein MMC21_002547 [Puttea exsequens]|nr:hypothetical protein [Puttea exsequens]